MTDLTRRGFLGAAGALGMVGATVGVDAYDQQGPAVNAMLHLNPRALQTADELNHRLRGGDPVPLHGILTYPHQQILPVPIGETNQARRNGILAAMSSSPAITVPAGTSARTATAPLGVPGGIEFLGRPWAEELLIGVAHGFEKATAARKPPQSVPALV